MRTGNTYKVKQPTKDEYETTIQDAFNNWERVYFARAYVNGELLSIISIHKSDNGYTVRTPFYSRFNKTGPKYIDRLLYATSRCWVMWRRGKPHVPSENPTRAEDA